jgi:hypothetical protein
VNYNVLYHSLLGFASSQEVSVALVRKADYTVIWV